jgi:hypothetical protein
VSPASNSKSAFASAATDQFHELARVPDSGDGGRSRWQRRDSPARDGESRLVEIGCLRVAPPPARRGADGSRASAVSWSRRKAVMVKRATSIPRYRGRRAAGLLQNRLGWFSYRRLRDR